MKYFSLSSVVVGIRSSLMRAIAARISAAGISPEPAPGAEVDVSAWTADFSTFFFSRPGWNVEKWTNKYKIRRTELFAELGIRPPPVVEIDGVRQGSNPCNG